MYVFYFYSKAKKRIQALNDRINMINERKKKLDSEFDKLSKEESNLAAEIVNSTWFYFVSLNIWNVRIYYK